MADLSAPQDEFDLLEDQFDFAAVPDLLLDNEAPIIEAAAPQPIQTFFSTPRTQTDSLDTLSEPNSPTSTSTTATQPAATEFFPPSSSTSSIHTSLPDSPLFTSHAPITLTTQSSIPVHPPSTSRTGNAYTIPSSRPPSPPLISTPTPTAFPYSASSPASEDYFNQDGMDDAFFTQAGIIMDSLQASTGPSTLTVPPAQPVASSSTGPPPRPVTLVPFKRMPLQKRSLNTEPQSPPKKKMKRKEKRTEADIAAATSLAASFDEDLTCTICFDYFAVAHSANPCGHTLCGSCSHSWMAKKKQCPVCRKAVENYIPNFTVDNLVEKHIELLADTDKNRNGEWDPGGSLWTEWAQRKKWKKPQPPPQPPARLSTNRRNGTLVAALPGWVWGGRDVLELYEHDWEG